MVSTGGNEGGRNNKSPYWGLIWAVAIMLCVSTMGLGHSSILRMEIKKREAQHATETCAAQSNKNSCQDSIAIRAVVASENAIGVAVWQTVFNFFGLIGLVGTVAFAGMAWREAKRSADADNAALEETRRGLEEARKDAIEQKDRFERQISVSRDSAERQLRAYIHMTTADVTDFGTEKPVTFNVRIKNVGKTPARKLRCKYGIAADINPNAYIMGFPDNLAVSTTVLGPGCEYILSITSKEPLLEWQIKEIEEGKLSLLVVGEIDYEDVFSKERRTDIKMYYNGRSNSKRGAAAKPTLTGNDAT